MGMTSYGITDNNEILQQLMEMPYCVTLNKQTLNDTSHNMSLYFVRSGVNFILDHTV